MEVIGNLTVKVIKFSAVNKNYSLKLFYAPIGKFLSFQRIIFIYSQKIQTLCQITCAILNSFHDIYSIVLNKILRMSQFNTIKGKDIIVLSILYSLI